MYRETAAKTCEITRATFVCGNPNTLIEHFAIDSRQVKPGDCFIAFKGEHVDGNTYLQAALDAGASVLVATEQPHPEIIEAVKQVGAALILIPDAETFLQTLARWYREQQTWLCIGVTGSCGKTTTKEFLASILSKVYKTYATKGNFNSTIGVPLSILDAPQDTKVFISEMGMNHEGEIDLIASCARPHIAVITNIGTSHIGMLGSKEKIARAKAECIAWLADPLPACIHVEPTLIMAKDDAYVSFIRKHFVKPCQVKMITAGPDEVSLNKEGCAVFSVEKAESVTLKLPGEAAAQDAMLAYTAAKVLGVCSATIIEGLEALEPTAMRTNILQTKTGVTIVDDSYNAAPASVENALKLLGSLSSERRVVVLGEMGELGDFAEDEHKKIAERLKEEKIDKIIFVGQELAKCMQKTYGSQNATVAKDYHEALKELTGEFLPNVSILIKGSRFLELDKLVKEVQKLC